VAIHMVGTHSTQMVTQQSPHGLHNMNNNTSQHFFLAFHMHYDNKNSMKACVCVCVYTHTHTHIYSMVSMVNMETTTLKIPA